MESLMLKESSLLNITLKSKIRRYSKKQIPLELNVMDPRGTMSVFGISSTTQKYFSDAQYNRYLSQFSYFDDMRISEKYIANGKRQSNPTSVHIDLALSKGTNDPHLNELVNAVCDPTNPMSYRNIIHWCHRISTVLVIPAPFILQDQFVVQTHQIEDDVLYSCLKHMLGKDKDFCDRSTAIFYFENAAREARESGRFDKLIKNVWVDSTANNVANIIVNA